MGRPQDIRECAPGLWRMLKYFGPYLRPHRALVAGSIASLFAGVALRLLEPWPLKFVFDRVIDPGRRGGPSGIPLVDDLDEKTLLTLSAVAVVAVTAARAMADYFNTVGFAQIGNRVMTEVRDDLYRHLQRLSLSYHAQARGGDLVVRIIGDVSMLKDVVVTAMLPLAANLFIWVGMVGLMAWMEWRLALLALTVLPIYWLSTFRTGRLIRETARRQRRREGAMAATAAESIGAIKTVQALSLEDKFATSFSSRSRQSQKEDIKGRKLSARLERTVDVLIATASALVLWQGARLVRSGAMTAGDLVVFLNYLRRAFNPLQDLAKYAGRLAKATAAGERVMDLLGREPEIRDLPHAVAAPAFRGAVRFEGVTFGYESGHPVLEGVDLDVAPGEHVAVVGPSGVGKSTLVGLLLRLHDPQNGCVRIDGGDVRGYRLDSLRAQVSVLLQDNLLFAASIRENIAQGCPEASDAAIETSARLANAHEFIAALPEGYDTVVGERGVTLSAGQRQRIAIARAAVRRSPILILDEPTNGLDEENERAVNEALRRLAEGRTTFLISHDLRAASRADRVVYVEGGRVREQGGHAELMNAAGRYAALYRLQAAADDHLMRPEGSHVLAT